MDDEDKEQKYLAAYIIASAPIVLAVITGLLFGDPSIGGVIGLAIWLIAVLNMLVN